MDLVSGAITGATLLAFLGPVFSALIIVVVGAILISIAVKFTGKILVKAKMDEALHTFVKNVVKVLLWIVVIITALGKLGIPTTTFVTVIGACGAAVALALKDSLGNVAGGILILVNKPFGKGDFIDIAGTTGVVDKIDLLVTILKTPDNKVVSVPNGNISTSVLTNYSREELRRVDCVFGIGYEASIGKARETIANVADSCPLILKDPGKQIIVNSQGDSSVNMESRVWCKSSDYWDVKFFMEENVKIAFDEANITIPYPQMDVHIIK